MVLGSAKVTTGSGTGSQMMYVDGECVAKVSGIDNDDRGNLDGAFVQGLSYKVAGFIDYVDDVVISQVDITSCNP